MLARVTSATGGAPILVWMCRVQKVRSFDRLRGFFRGSAYACQYFDHRSATVGAAAGAGCGWRGGRGSWANGYGSERLARDLAGLG
jgi:hypothetical protein